MLPPGHVPPLPSTEDIPIHRPSIGAMGLSAPADTFKPYVYGASPLVLRPEWNDPPPEPRAKPKRDPAKIRAANIKRWERANLSVAEAAAREAQRMLDISDTSTWANFPKQLKPKPKKRKKAKRKHQPKPRPTIPPLPRQPARPSRGWQPLTGADLEDAWAMLEER